MSTWLLERQALKRYSLSMQGRDVSFFSQCIADGIEKARVAAGLTVRSLCDLTGMGRNTYFTKRRGESFFNTEDIAKITEVLNVDLLTFIQQATDLKDQGNNRSQSDRERGKEQ